MPIDPARGLQLRADSVATRLYQERLYSSGPAGARRAGLEFVCVFGHDGLSWNEIRARAADFACEWADATYEKGETQSFYNEFFDIFGVRRRTVARYEEHVRRLDNTSGFIDLFWPGVLLVGYFRVNERFRSLESTCNFHPPRMCSFRPALTLGLAAA